MKHCLVPLLVAGLCTPAAFAVQDILADYVHAPDDSYGFELHSHRDDQDATIYNIRLTSQTWRNIEWTHWLTIVVPNRLTHHDTGLLLIDGGSAQEQPRDLASREASVLAGLALQTGSVVSVVHQVPNQPLFDGLMEDAIIALTFERFLQGEGDDWPLLLPMTKSAVRAMDAVQEFLQEQHGAGMEHFVVTGASKRGWTAWLTAAVDDRVKAIMPMVIDVLNVSPQMEHQLNSYGRYSDMIGDYTERDLQEHLDSEGGRRLLDIVDPYAYRERLDLPKLILLGTNDQYWTVDAANLYLGGLRGPTYLRYEPNAGHGLGEGVVPSIHAFYSMILNNDPLPVLDWSTDEDNTLRVSWEGDGVRARLWTAESPARDFRQARWTSEDLPVDGSECVVALDAPAAGWRASYVEVLFPSEGGPRFGLTTAMHVLPNRYPGPHELRRGR